MKMVGCLLTARGRGTSGERTRTFGEGGLRPQHILRRRSVLPLVAAVAHQIRPVWVAEAVIALGNRADFRWAVDPDEYPVARLLGLAEQLVDVPPHELALPVHDL